MKKIRRLVISLILASIGILTLAIPVFAAPANVTGFMGNPSDTSIVLTWLPASGATSYVVQYRTDTYPSSHSDGTNAYTGSNTQATLSGLTSGQSYYFAVWGYDGASYSTIGTTLVSTTLSTAIPNGAQVNPTLTIPVPTIPANATQTPVITGFHLSPFTDILEYLNDTNYGGLGMPIANLWEVIVIGIILIMSVITYIKLKNFLIAYGVMLFLSVIGVGIHLLQGFILPWEIVIGLGVWALERFFQ